MMKRLVMMLVMASALVSLNVFAANDLKDELKKERPSLFNYNYVEAQLRFFDSDLIGPRVKGSFDVHSNFSVIGSLGYYLKDKSNVDSQVLQLSAGAAYHANVGEMFDFDPLAQLDVVIHAQLEYLKTEAETKVCVLSTCIKRKSDDDDFGIYHGAEARYAVLNDLEAYVDISLRTTGDTDLIVSSGVRFAIIDQLKLTAGFELADDENISLGARYSF